MAHKYSIGDVSREVYCSSTGHYTIRVVVGVAYGSKIARQRCDFNLGIHNEWWERAPKYLRREMWERVFQIHDGIAFRLVEYDFVGNPRYAALRYADAEQFASILELYREELK